jgi:hypothetical protein
VDLIALREALEASWSARTSYGGVWEEGNPALGQCYPTARETLDRNELGDSPATVARCSLLLTEVEAHLRQAAR